MIPIVKPKKLPDPFRWTILTSEPDEAIDFDKFPKDKVIHLIILGYKRISYKSKNLNAQTVYMVNEPIYWPNVKPIIDRHSWVLGLTSWVGVDEMVRLISKTYKSPETIPEGAIFPAEGILTLPRLI